MKITAPTTEQLKDINNYKIRQKYARDYSWAVPSEEAVKKIAELSPIVEIGAGTGYWASLISSVGGNIRAFDLYLRDQNYYGHNQTHFNVEFGSVYSLRDSEVKTRKTLLLCWPPCGENLAVNSLRTFKGEFLAYIGESEWGCTANDAFFNLLAKKWIEVERVDIPRWDGIWDFLTIYRRR